MQLDNYNRWYEDEHISMLQRVPGYLNTIRAKLAVSSGHDGYSHAKYAAFTRFKQTGIPRSLDQYKDAETSESRTRILAQIQDGGTYAESEWPFVVTRSHTETTEMSAAGSILTKAQEWAGIQI